MIPSILKRVQVALRTHGHETKLVSCTLLLRVLSENPVSKTIVQEFIDLLLNTEFTCLKSLQLTCRVLCHLDLSSSDLALKFASEAIREHLEDARCAECLANVLQHMSSRIVHQARHDLVDLILEAILTHFNISKTLRSMLYLLESLSDSETRDRIWNSSAVSRLCDGVRNYRSSKLSTSDVSSILRLVFTVARDEELRESEIHVDALRWMKRYESYDPNLHETSMILLFQLKN